MSQVCEEEIIPVKHSSSFLNTSVVRSIATGKMALSSKEWRMTVGIVSTQELGLLGEGGWGGGSGLLRRSGKQFGDGGILVIMGSIAGIWVRSRDWVGIVAIGDRVRSIITIVTTLRDRTS